jgi:hypothetical protein
LIPMVDEGTYLNEMYNAASVGAINSDDRRVQAIMDPNFLFMDGVEPNAAEWFLQGKLKQGIEPVLKWIRNQGASIARLVGADAKKAGPVLGILAKVLGKQGGSDGAQVAGWLLNAAIPEEQKALASDTPGARSLAMTLMNTTDEKVANAILDWLAGSKPPITALACLNINSALPEAVKTKAKELAATAPPIKRKKAA